MVLVLPFSGQSILEPALAQPRPQKPTSPTEAESSSQQTMSAPGKLLFFPGNRRNCGLSFAHSQGLAGRPEHRVPCFDYPKVERNPGVVDCPKWETPECRSAMGQVGNSGLRSESPGLGLPTPEPLTRSLEAS